MSDNIHSAALPQKESWHLDKKVPLSLIFAIIAQTAAFVYWGARLEGETKANATDIARIERDATVRRNEDRVELKEALRDLRDGIRRIEDELKRKADRP